MALTILAPGGPVRAFTRLMLGLLTICGRMFCDIIGWDDDVMTSPIMPLTMPPVLMIRFGADVIMDELTDEFGGPEELMC